MILATECAVDESPPWSFRNPAILSSVQFSTLSKNPVSLSSHFTPLKIFETTFSTVLIALTLLYVCGPVVDSTSYSRTS